MNTDRDALLALLHQIDAYDFEHVVSDLWDRQGWETNVTQGANDRGVDVIATREDPFEQKLAIQVKRYDPASTVGSPEIQQYASLRQQVPNVDAVVVVTTAQFTASAENTAGDLNVKLVDGDQLCELIETYNAYDILQSYVNLEAGTEPSRELTADTDILDQSPSNTSDPIDVSAPTHSETSSVTPPDSLSGLISLRKTIADELATARDNIELADSAFTKKSFGTAVDTYSDVLETLIDLQQDLERYDAGFDTIDTTAATHLDSPDEFREELVELREYTADQVRKAKDYNEKAAALQTLADEIETAAETATTQLSRGDRLRSNGNYKQAENAYEEAADAVAEATATRDTYRGMAEGYEGVLPEEADVPPADINLEALASNLDDRTEWTTNTQAEESYESAARHEFLSEEVLERTHVARDGLTNEPPKTYLNDDELPRFAFYSKVKGHTVQKTSGNENQIQSGRGYGSLFLLTDTRVLLLTGQDDGDTVMEVSRPVEAEYSTGRFKNRLTIIPQQDGDTSKVDLWVDSEFDEKTLKAAAEYLRSDQPARGRVDSSPPVENTNFSPADLSTETRVEESPQRIVDQADGSFSKKVLQKTRGRLHGQPLIDYLAPEEKLEYVLWHRNKGFRITKPDGTEETPHHTASNGARYLLVTDHRLIYVAGEDGFDDSMSFSYDEISYAREAGGIGSWSLEFKITDGTTYKFAENGTHANDVEKAVDYIRSKT